MTKEDVEKLQIAARLPDGFEWDAHSPFWGEYSKDGEPMEGWICCLREVPLHPQAMSGTFHVPAHADAKFVQMMVYVAVSHINKRREADAKDQGEGS